MTRLRKIVLNSVRGYGPHVDALVAEFMGEGVVFVGVVGLDCAKIEEIIDEFAVGDGSRAAYRMLTSSHPGESLERSPAPSSAEFANWRR